MISLPGNSFVAIVFSPAQAPGQDTAVHGFSVKCGDDEGYVSYGLGVDGYEKLRVGESRRPDGTCVVSVDVSASWYTRKSRRRNPAPPTLVKEGQ